MVHLSPTSPEQVPLVHADPAGTDPHARMKQMYELGPVVRIVLPGMPPGVWGWAVTRHQYLDELSRHPGISRDWETHWAAYRDGLLPPDWPLKGMFLVRNMFTSDGESHRRQRKVLSQVFTPRRIEQMRDQITAIVANALDDLPRHAGPSGAVDLRHFAYRVPMDVICDLLGVPPGMRPDLRAQADALLATADKTTGQAADTELHRQQLLRELIDLRRANPGDDLTSALVAAAGNIGDDTFTGSPDDSADDSPGGERLTDTVWMLVVAGHETTLALILNATRALLTHPEQRAIAQRGGEAIWEAVVEETLRWDGPIDHLVAGYTRQPVTVADTTIPAGQLMLGLYAGVGRDSEQHGATAHAFDITRPTTGRHLSFGVGSHFCLGAPLARTEGRIALPALLGRYPQLRLAVDPDELAQVPSLFTNTLESLPVHLGPAA